MNIHMVLLFIHILWCVWLHVDRRPEHSDEGRGENGGRKNPHQFFRSTRHSTDRVVDVTRIILTEMSVITGRLYQIHCQHPFCDISLKVKTR